MSKALCATVLLAAVLALVDQTVSQATTPIVATTGHVDNDTQKEECTRVAKPCVNGLLLPAWKPIGNLSAGDKAARAIVYMAGMVFMFLGVSIIADRFMAAIEVITSKEKEITVKKPNGETTTVHVRIWNETVSNLTLMALGSSAPEILLSVIEICGNKFEAGDLGPSTIVGSAAFNLFVIIAICVHVIPDGEVRRIKHLRVFFITASWSIFAYLWLYLIIAVSSKGVVEIWEALLTFLFFPATVITAYIADRKIFFHNFLSKKYRASRSKKVVVTSEGDVEMDGKANHYGDEVEFKGADGGGDAEMQEFEKHRKEYIDILRELRKKHPNIDMKTLEEMAEYEVMNRGPKSRAFYRIQATRKLTGGGNVIKKSKIERRNSEQDVKVDLVDDDIQRIFFDPGHYTVMENVGTFHLTVTRSGGDTNNTIYVDYKTEDGSANHGSDYEYAEGTLIFMPGEMHKQFPVSVIDDDIFEEDEHFYVRLSNIRVGDPNGLFTNDSEVKVQLANPSLATVMILDDDHAGIFHFEQKATEVVESIGDAEIKVVRSSGARGRVAVPYHTRDGTAVGGKDFEITTGEVIFENDETEQIIKIRIIDDEEYEKKETFSIELGDPRLVRRGSITGENLFCGTVDSGSGGEGDTEKGWLSKKDEDEDSGAHDVHAKVNSGEPLTEEERLAELGKPILGDTTRIEVAIRESMEFKSTVDKLLKKANLSLVVGTSSWREQFVEAISVSAGDDDEDEDEEKLPSCMDYVMHFLTIFWKVLFACVPPTDYWSGWACFVVSISMIGLLTAVIGDLASSFGCTVGMKDSVTAITFVALGTSVPDTFASKVAAVGDAYADSSIGNVTGSNAVNVFLGIGVAWLIAAVYHAIDGTPFNVPPGSLGFSVTVYVISAVVAITLMMIRRHKCIGGELGGPKLMKIFTVIFLFGLWVLYVVISSLETYCWIKGF
ncbi:sodium/calcium exchanger 1-like isoform X3 [Lineus longissimus]|uniref:sodium/calcium exchanger 1-like isoform X3 n=1 Tax=Lineus longissimus TaxID=88925 RepID=UPI00315DC324